MVLHFATIPLHLQTKILTQSNIYDAVEFQQTSKHARDVGDIVKQIPMDILGIEVTQDDILFIKEEKSIFWNDREVEENILKWSILKKYDNYPRFYTYTVTDRGISNDRWVDILQEFKENGIYGGRNVTLKLIGPPVLCKDDVFDSIFETLDVVEYFSVEELGPEFMKAPAFQKLKRLKLMNSVIDDEDLLALEASEIQIQTNSRTISPVLHAYFMQWYSGNRDITNFSLYSKSVPGWFNFSPGVIFENIPSCTILMCNNRHRNTLLSEMADDMNMGSPSYYSVKNNSDTLLVKIAYGFISARKVIYLEEEFKYELIEW